MKREAIKKMVESAANRNVAKAARAEGEYRAREMVREAVQEGRDDAEGETPESEAREHGVKLEHDGSRSDQHSTVVSSSDPRLAGG